ncbi:MAG: NUDIX hydrolase [Oscillospiraceae bacterium]|jgi:ADP-ribose pyrophosphatase|nr:NUDIX hydrolase [Oscillospiraceae bacterium]
MDLTERRISGETVFEGRIFTVERDVIEQNGRLAEREVVRHPGGVAVLALDGSGRVVMVRQFRYAAGRVLLEIPAGRLERGEDPLAAGERELSEETGYSASRVVPFGKFIPTGGYDSEVIHLCLAEGLTPGDTHPDDGEIVCPELIPLEKALKMALDGEIEDGKTIVALMKYALLRGRGNG